MTLDRVGVRWRQVCSTESHETSPVCQPAPHWAKQRKVPMSLHVAYVRCCTALAPDLWVMTTLYLCTFFMHFVLSSFRPVFIWPQLTLNRHLISGALRGGDWYRGNFSFPTVTVVSLSSVSLVVGKPMSSFHLCLPYVTRFKFNPVQLMMLSIYFLGGLRTSTTTTTTRFIQR